MTGETKAPSKRHKGRRLRGWLTDIVLILLLIAGIQWWKARPLVQGEAPLLTGRALDGEIIDLKALRGQPVLVHFWATWCPVCKVMNGAIDGLAEDHRVITVALQSGGHEKIQAFMREAGRGFAVISDPDGRIAQRWGVAGVPATFILDAEGQIRYATVGVSTGPGLRLRLWAAD